MGHRLREVKDLTLVQGLRRLVRLAGLDDLVVPGEIESVLPDLARTLRLVASEAAVAEDRGLRLSEAAADDLQYPNLNRLHLAVRDVLTMELPDELCTAARQVVQHWRTPIVDDLQLQLGRVAVAEDRPALERSLARVLLFEGIRAGLILSEFVTEGGLASLGVGPEDLDDIAEEELGWWLERAPLLGREVRPLNVLVAAALVQLERHRQELRGLLAHVRGDAGAALRRRAELERRLRNMNSVDAVLLRNVFGPAVGEERETIAHLQEHHPLVLRNRKRAAIDQRTARLMRRIRRGDWPTRRGTALVDLLAESLGSKESGR